jgi:hypothetical protein
LAAVLLLVLVLVLVLRVVAAKEGLTMDTLFL